MGIIKNMFAGATKSFEDMGGFTIQSSVFGKSNMYKKYSSEELLSMYKGWIFAAADAIGDGMAMLEWGLYKDESKLQRIEHDYLKFIDSKTIKAISIFLKTLGEVYIYKVKAGNKIIELKMLKSWNVIEKTGDLGEVLYYQYFDGTAFYRFEKEDLIVFKSFSPLFEQAGMTPLKAAASQMAMDLASIEYNRLFFENGGRPGTVLKSASKIDSDVRDKYLAKWKANFVGLQNSNKVAFLDQGIELQDFSSNQKDMELTQQRTFTRDEILMMFRVGTPILGKSDGVGFADKRVPGYYLTQFALKPLGEFEKEDLNSQLFNGIGYFCFEYPEDKDDLLKEYQGNVITLNQYLVATGRPQVKNGNRLWDGTEVEFEEVKAVSESAVSKDFERSIEKGLNRLKNVKDFGTEEYNQKQWESKIVRTDVYEKEMIAIQKKIFSAQEKEILKNLSDTKSIKKIEKIEDLFDPKKSNLLYITLYTKFFQKMMGKEGEISIGEISDEAFAIAKLNQWIGENIDRMSQDIDAVTRTEMFEIVKQGNRDGVGSDQIAANIRSAFNQYTRKTGRVEKIARTEVTRASNKSQDEAYIQSGVVAKKEWYTAIDERVCPYCSDMHKKTVSLEEPFLKLGEEHLGQKIDYEIVNYPPRHVNCRCTIRPIITRKSFEKVSEKLKQKGINFNF